MSDLSECPMEQTDELLPLVVWSSENCENTKWSICRHVGDLDSDDHTCIATIKGRDAATVEARARYLAHACNLYPEAIAALKECSFRLAALVTASGDFSDANAKALDAATAALQKAEGVSHA